MKKPAIFLDRDGTINVEKNYLHKIEGWEWIPGAIDAIRMINNMGFIAVVVTNQAGIARGYYAEKDVKRLHQQVDDELKKNSAWIDAYYFCPHHPEFGDKEVCSCRKPRPGMLLQAREDLNIDLEASWLIGDKLSDIDAAREIGVKPILVMTGYGEQEKRALNKSVPYEKDLYSAVKLISKEVSLERVSSDV